MLLNKVCAFVDLETTGISAKSEAITEVALRLYHPGGELFHWQQLLNPGKPIPGMIQQLTGISNAMVAEQPYFDEIAPQLYEWLSDAIFVAHNARFDYGFLKAAFAHCGYTFKPKIVCTVKLARALYPEFSSHSLDSVCAHIGYRRTTSHRAMADIEAMCAFVQHAIDDKDIQQVNATAERQFRRPSQPTHIPAQLIDDIPNGPGVYRFYGEDRTLLYIGKSIKLRERVKAHFSADLDNEKERRLSQEVRDIDWTVTVGELGALLLENQEIKTRSPIFNRRQRRYKSLWCYELLKSSSGNLIPRLTNRPFGDNTFSRQLYGMFQGRNPANKWLQQIVRDHRLCKRSLGLEKTSGSCFSYQLKQCRGACVGEESPAQHNLRVIEAFDSKRIEQWPFDGPAFIIESAEDSANQGIVNQAIHVIDQWALLGTVDSADAIYSVIDNPVNSWFDRETYRLLNHSIHLARPVAEARQLSHETA